MAKIVVEDVARKPVLKTVSQIKKLGEELDLGQEEPALQLFSVGR